MSRLPFEALDKLTFHGHPTYGTSEERDCIKALEREVKELRRANEILKLASAFLTQAELDRRLKS